MHLWQQLYNRVQNGGKPITAVAPMADVTDRAYRFHMLNESGYDAIDVLWSEFVAVDGLVSRGKYQLMRDLQFSSLEQPKLVAQIFGSNASKFVPAVELLCELGFTAIDINMGCPDKTINKQGAGACLIQTPETAATIIRTAKTAAGNIPVSVKTRIGWSTDETDTWIPTLLDAGIDALTVHARTRKEMSDYPPHWDIMSKVVDLAKPYNIPVIANGGILTTDAGELICEQTGSNGYMVGKGTFGNPYFFALGGNMPTKRVRLQSALDHLRLYHDWIFCNIGPDEPETFLTFGDKKIIAPELVRGKSLELMKKNFRCYISDWPGSSELRSEIMNEKTFDGLLSIFERERD